MVAKGDVIQDFKRIFEMMEAKGICQGASMLFEAYAAFLIAKGDLLQANKVYRLGISRFLFGFVNLVFILSGVML